MAKDKEKSCLWRRRLLNMNGLAPEKLSQIGREFMETGFLSDAVDFFAKAEDTQGLERLLVTVINEGDLFLFKRIVKCLDRQIEPTELKDLSENAERLGKISFAAQTEGMLNGDKSPIDSE